MNKSIFVLFAILAVCATTIQATGRRCRPSCPKSISPTGSGKTRIVKKGSCAGACWRNRSCTGSSKCLYNPRSGSFQGAISFCRCRSGATPTPSQVVRALSMDLAKKEDISDDVWDKRYLEDAVNNGMPLLN